MKKFSDGDFLLNTPTAKRLYHAYAENQPIIDYHCHLSAQDIYEDKKFKNISEIWLGEDHYKWRLMRSFGVDESYITGGADDREKFGKWVESLSLAIGNPLYQWSHMELSEVFGYKGVIKPENADEIWNICSEKLAQPEFSARELILKAGVKVICTTDDPADSLEWHKKLKSTAYPVKVLPGYRPDKALNIESGKYAEYLKTLGNIKNFRELKSALKARLNYFVSLGCKVSDHALAAVPFAPVSEQETAEIFEKKLAGRQLSEAEIKKFKFALLVFLGKEYAARNMVMQLHFGVMRDLSDRLFEAFGADAGADSIGDCVSVSELALFLNELDRQNALPKTVLYSLNPNDNAAIETVMGAFQTSQAKGKLQHGSAWWFNDSKQGITQHLTSLASLGHLATFIGMLTDSRSFLSYVRHDYFRRILCSFVGELVENGEYPDDEELLGKIITGICYGNAKEYFNF